MQQTGWGQAQAGLVSQLYFPLFLYFSLPLTPPTEKYGWLMRLGRSLGMRLWTSFGVYHPSVNHFIVFFFLALPQSIMFSVIDDVPEMVDFFWEPPPPVQKNGIIT